MLLFVQRRARQLTMARKIFGREAASAARNFRGEEQLCIAISCRRDLTKNEKASAMRTSFKMKFF
jgi:hypothetical protein